MQFQPAEEGEFSTGDDTTSAHEHVFLLTKSARYFYDATAIRENNKGTRGKQSWTKGSTAAPQNDRSGWDGVGRNKRNVWEINTQP